MHNQTKADLKTIPVWKEIELELSSIFTKNVTHISHVKLEKYQIKIKSNILQDNM